MQIIMKHVFHYIKDLFELEFIHGSGEDQDSHGIMVTIMVMEIIMEDTSVTGICTGGSSGKLLKVTNTNGG